MLSKAIWLCLACCQSFNLLQDFAAIDEFSDLEWMMNVVGGVSLISVFLGQ